MKKIMTARMSDSRVIRLLVAGLQTSNSLSVNSQTGKFEDRFRKRLKNNLFSHKPIFPQSIVVPSFRTL